MKKNIKWGEVFIVHSDFVNKSVKGKQVNKRAVVSHWLACDDHKHILLPLYSWARPALWKPLWLKADLNPCNTLQSYSCVEHSCPLWYYPILMYHNELGCCPCDPSSKLCARTGINQKGFFLNVYFLQFWHLLRARPDPPFPLQEDRRQSVSRQPSFTYSEWTEDKNEDDFLDLDPVPETPVFDCVMDIKVETDPATLTVKSVGLQER